MRDFRADSTSTIARGHRFPAAHARKRTRLDAKFMALGSLWWLLVLARSRMIPHPSILELAGCVLLISIATIAPVRRPHARSYTFAEPALFGVLLWTGPLCAGIAGLLGTYLAARFSPLLQGRRAEARQAGMRMVVACLAAGGGWLRPLADRASSRFPEIPPEAAYGAIAAGAFTLSIFLLATLLPWRTGGERARERREAQYIGRVVFAAGMTPVLLLYPFSARSEAGVVLCVAAFWVMGARVLGLEAEVDGLRDQAKTATAIGAAGITDHGGSADPAPLLRHFLELANEYIHADRAIIWLLDEQAKEFELVAACPDAGAFGGRRYGLVDGLIGLAAAQDRVRVVADASRAPGREGRREEPEAWLLYPLAVEGRLLGVAQWIRPSTRPFTLAEAKPLATLVPQAALALEHMRQRAAIHALAATDGLTGLWNQRKMREVLRDEMSRATRYYRPVAILMMDVDNFKSYNDTYGHPMGDLLLKRFAGILRSGIRSQDRVGRFGGEEFLAILPETGLEEAALLAERIRARAEAESYVVINGERAYRTVSIGIAAYPAHSADAVALLAAADEALYRAKRAGKNRVGTALALSGGWSTPVGES